LDLVSDNCGNQGKMLQVPWLWLLLAGAKAVCWRPHDPYLVPNLLGIPESSGCPGAMG